MVKEIRMFSADDGKVYVTHEAAMKADNWHKVYMYIDAESIRDSEDLFNMLEDEVRRNKFVALLLNYDASCANLKIREAQSKDELAYRALSKGV